MGRIKKTSSAADLGQNSGIQGAPTSGQCSRETAVPKSSSSAQRSRAGEWTAGVMRTEEKEEGDYRMYGL